MMQRLSPPRAPELLRRVAPALGRPLALGAIGLGVGAAAFYGAVGGGRLDVPPTPRPTVQVAEGRPAAAPTTVERPATPTTAPTPTASAPTPTEAAVPTLAALAIPPSASPPPTVEP